MVVWCRRHARFNQPFAEKESFPGLTSGPAAGSRPVANHPSQANHE